MSVESACKMERASQVATSSVEQQPTSNQSINMADLKLGQIQAALQTKSRDFQKLEAGGLSHIHS